VVATTHSNNIFFVDKGATVKLSAILHSGPLKWYNGSSRHYQHENLIRKKLIPMVATDDIDIIAVPGSSTVT